MSVLIRIALLVAGCWLLLRAVLRFAGSMARRPQVPPPSDAAKPLVRDPECGIWLPEERAVSSIEAGKPVFYCSEECRTKHLSAAG